MCAGVVLASLDLFIVNVALPDISRDFGHASLGELSWVLNGYAIVYASLLVFFGRLADRHRRDYGFLLGVAIFTAGSAACAPRTAWPCWWRSGWSRRSARPCSRRPRWPGARLLPAGAPRGAVRTWTAIGGLAAPWAR